MFNNSDISHPVNNHYKKYLWVFTKVIIMLLTYGYISYELSTRQGMDNIIDSLKNNFITSNITFLILAIILLPFNLLVEAAKWRFLVKKLERISIFMSLKAVISGIALAIFTPNRIGEIASRVFVLKRLNRTKGIFSSAAGTMATLIITIFTGVLSCIIFLLLFSHSEILQGNKPYYYGIPVFLYCTLLIVIFFNLSRFVKFLTGFKLLSRFKDSFEVLSSYKKKEIYNILLFSLLRYLIYSTQFMLLLFLFNVNINVFTAYLGIAISYFFISFIPSFTLAEIGIRGSVSIFFIGYFSDNAVGIFSAASLVWIINIVIPALIGSILVYKLKF